MSWDLPSELEDDVREECAEAEVEEDEEEDEEESVSLSIKGYTQYMLLTQSNTKIILHYRLSVPGG